MIEDIADRLMNPQGIWPWAEANQGLLSVVALIAALSIAVYEIRQSSRRDVRAVVEYIDWVLNCADQAIQITDDAIRHQQTDGREGEGVSFPVWQMLSANAVATLQEIQPMRPAHPKLAHHVNRLLRAMAKDLQPMPHAPSNADMLEHYKTYVVIERDHIAALRPRIGSVRLTKQKRFALK